VCGPGAEARRRSRAGHRGAGDAGKKKGKEEMGAPTGGAAASERESDPGCWAAGKHGATGRAEQAAGKGKGNGPRGKEPARGGRERGRPGYWASWGWFPVFYFLGFPIPFLFLFLVFKLKSI
jgi:hypothetical protein